MKEQIIQIVAGVCILHTFYQLGQSVYKRIFQTRKVLPQQNTIIDLIGNTPLVYLKRLSQLTGCEIYAKCQFMNPFGSNKDRMAKQILLDAISAGKLDRVSQPYVFEGTSGSTGISLSQAANCLGLKSQIIIPNDLAEEKIRLLEILSDMVVKVPPVSIVDSNHFCQLAQTLSQENNHFFADQFENPSNFKAQYETTAQQIYSQTNGLIDIFVSSSGTGGTIAAISTFLQQKRPQVKVILADPPGSSLQNQVKYGVCFNNVERETQRAKNPFDTITQGVGLNRITANFSKALIDDAYTITDQETLHMAHFLIQNEGIFPGTSTAMNCVACVKAARQAPQGSLIVTIFCDSGSRYLTQFYNPEYIKKTHIQFEPLNTYRNINHLDFVSNTD